MAVQINAYNFPVWSLLGKLAPALIAGVPVIAKPASQTSISLKRSFGASPTPGFFRRGPATYLRQRRHLLDHLGSQDVIAFTGSAATAAALGHRNVAAHSVRFNAEADSLNSAILAPDAIPGTAEFDLFVAEVTREMTERVGQVHRHPPRVRSTRISFGCSGRPSGQARRSTVGTSADAEVTMGPLVSLEQRESVRAAVKELRSAGEIVFGDPDVVDVMSSVPSAAPSCLRCCCSVPIQPGPSHMRSSRSGRSAQSCRTTRSRMWSIWSCVAGQPGNDLATSDPATARRVVGDAPWHGRLHILNQSSAAESTGHGAVLAQLVHGRFGRRGVGLATARPAPIPTAHGPTGVPGHDHQHHASTLGSGAERRTGGVHPFRKYLEELRLGTRSSRVHGWSRWRTSRSSPSSQGTPSTPTWTRRRRGPIPSLRAGGAWIPGSCDRRRSLRGAVPGSCPRQLRGGSAPGSLSRSTWGRAHRHSHCQGDPAT